MGEAARPVLSTTSRRFRISKVSKQVVMSFCVAGVALCDIPICLITCRRCRNWMKSRTECSFCCAHVSPLESMVFLWRRRVYGRSCQISPFRRFPRTLSCRFAWQQWHFATFELYTLHFTLYTPHSALSNPHSTLYTLHSTLYTPHSTLYTPHSLHRYAR